MTLENKLKPCPFCGCDLTQFPLFMVVHHATSDAYVKWLIETKQIIGSDDSFVVNCIKCGAVSPRGISKESAIEEWNRRCSAKVSGGDKNE